MLTDTVPCTLRIENWSGTDERKAIAGANGVGLTLEYEVKGSLFGLAELALRTRWFRWKRWRPFSTVKRVWGGKIVVRAKSMRALEGIPGANHAELTLWIERKDREIAEQFVQTLRLRLIEHDLRHLEAGNWRL